MVVMLASLPGVGMCMQTTEMDILALYVMMVGDKMKLMLFAGIYTVSQKKMSYFAWVKPYKVGHFFGDTVYIQ